jgi:hypothetical protein
VIDDQRRGDALLADVRDDVVRGLENLVAGSSVLGAGRCSRTCDRVAGLAVRFGIWAATARAYAAGLCTIGRAGERALSATEVSRRFTLRGGPTRLVLVMAGPRASVAGAGHNTERCRRLPSRIEMRKNGQRAAPAALSGLSFRLNGTGVPARIGHRGRVDRIRAIVTAMLSLPARRSGDWRSKVPGTG